MSATLENVAPQLDSKDDVNKLYLPLDDVSVLQNLTLDNEWTLCIIVCSTFQIALHKMTKSEKVLQLMEVDLRLQIQECQEEIPPCANLIPMISPNILRPIQRLKMF